MTTGNIKKSGTSGKVLKDATSGKLKRCDCCAGQCVCCASDSPGDCCVAVTNAPCGGGGGQPACQLDYPFSYDGSASIATTVTWNNAPAACPDSSDDAGGTGDETDLVGESFGETCTGMGVTNNGILDQTGSTTATFTGFWIPRPNSGFSCSTLSGGGLDFIDNNTTAVRQALISLAIANVFVNPPSPSACDGNCTASVSVSACVGIDGGYNVGINIFSVRVYQTAASPQAINLSDSDEIENTLTASVTVVTEGCAFASMTLEFGGYTKYSLGGSPIPFDEVQVDVSGSITVAWDGITGAPCAVDYDGEVEDPEE